MIMSQWKHKQSNPFKFDLPGDLVLYLVSILLFKFRDRTETRVQFFHQIFQLRHPISRRNIVRIRSSFERPWCCILYLKVKFRYYFINKVQFNFLDFSWLLVTNRRNVIKFYYTIFNLKRSPLLQFDPLSSNVHPVFQRRNSTNRSAKIRNRLEYGDVW